MNASTPFFSIIIPTLNEEKFIPKLLKCLKNQSFKNFELIICDGASSDQTIKIINSFSRFFPRLTILENLKRNVSYQRNTGAEKASGEFLVFFDADVAVGGDFLKKVYQHIIKEESLLLTTWLEADSDDIFAETMILITNIAISLTKFTKKPFLPGFDIIVERNTFFTIGKFDERIRHAEDFYFAQRAKKKGIILRCINDAVLTCSLRRFRHEGTIEVLRKYLTSLIHIVFKGPITNDLFEYQMGGGYFGNRKKQNLSDRLKKKFSKFINI